MDLTTRKTFIFSLFFLIGRMAEGAPLELKEVLSTALANSARVTNAQKKFEISQLERQNASALFWPSVDLAAEHGLRGDSPSRSASPWASLATLSLTENLYDNGESLARLKISDQNLKNSESLLKQARGQLIVSVSGLYFDYCVAATRLKFSERNQELVDKQLNLAREQFQQGVKTRKDFVSLQAQAQRGQIELLNARNGLAKSRKALIEAIGLSPTSDMEFSAEFVAKLKITDLPSSVSPVSLIEEKLIEGKRVIAELEIELSRRKSLPRVNLSAGASYGSSNNLEAGRAWRDGEQSSWNVMLKLDWNLLDFGQRSRNVAVVRLQQAIEEQDLKSGLLAAQKDLENLRIELRNFARAYELAKSLKKLEDDNYRLLESEYRQGRVSYLELVTALSNLLDAQQKDAQVDYDLHRLWVRKKYYEGTLDENVFN